MMMSKLVMTVIMNDQFSFSQNYITILAINMNEHLNSLQTPDKASGKSKTKKDLSGISTSHKLPTMTVS